jgi:hypothetical protein
MAHVQDAEFHKNPLFCVCVGGKRGKRRTRRDRLPIVYSFKTLLTFKEKCLGQGEGDRGGRRVTREFIAATIVPSQ